MAIMDLFNRTPTPTIAQRASPFSSYPYYDYGLTLPGVEPMTIRLQTGCFTFSLMSGVSPPDILPESRLPDRLTHAGGGCWIALYRKYTNRAAYVRPLSLPTGCPPATTCAVEITLHSGGNAAIIASYLPQSVEEHERA